MDTFNARFDLISTTSISENEWNIVANIIDNTGNFFAQNVQINDIIYLNGSVIGMGILRYKVTSIYPETAAVELHAKVLWEIQSESPIEPIPGTQGVIGYPTGLGLITLPSMSINMLDESFINSIKNFENKNIIDTKLGKIDSPEFTGKPVVPTPTNDANDSQIANTNWTKTNFKTKSETYTCGEVINQYQIVYIDNTDKIRIANVSNLDNADQILGIALESGIIDQQIPVAIDGEISNPLWNFDVNKDSVFIGNNGELIIDISGITTYIQKIGRIINAQTIILDIEDAVLL